METLSASPKNSYYIEFALSKARFKHVQRLVFFNDDGSLQKTSGQVFSNHMSQLFFFIEPGEKEVKVRPHLKTGNLFSKKRTIISPLCLFGIHFYNPGLSLHDILNWEETQGLINYISARHPLKPNCPKDIAAFVPLLDRIENCANDYYSERQQQLLNSNKSLEQYSNVESIAEQMHMHPRTLQRLCKSTLGFSPKQWLLQLRREYSLKNGLIDCRLSSSYYSDQAHQIREFKHFTTLTPGQFRKSWQQKSVRFIQSPHPIADLGLLLHH